MKFLSFLLCLALLVVAIMYTPRLASGDVVAGAGSGKNEVIHAPSDMCALLDFICGDNENSLDATGIPSAISLSTNGQRSAATEYDSVTIHEVSYTSVVSEDAAYSLNREMDMYICSTASYYHSVGVVSQSGENTAMLLTFDMEVFIDYNTQKGYYKFNRWEQYGEGAMQFSADILGKWLYVTTGMNMSHFSSIDLANREGFETIGNALDRADRSGKLEHKKSKYSLPSEEVQNVLGVNGRLELDLRNADEPTLTLSVNDQAGTTSVFTETVYRFANINNTVVRMDKGADILELTEKELDQYVLGSAD